MKQTAPASSSAARGGGAQASPPPVRSSAGGKKGKTTNRGADMSRYAPKKVREISENPYEENPNLTFAKSLRGGGSTTPRGAKTERGPKPRPPGPNVGAGPGMRDATGRKIRSTTPRGTESTEPSTASRGPSRTRGPTIERQDSRSRGGGSKSPRPRDSRPEPRNPSSPRGIGHRGTQDDLSGTGGVAREEDERVVAAFEERLQAAHETRGQMEVLAREMAQEEDSLELALRSVMRIREQERHEWTAERTLLETRVDELEALVQTANEEREAANRLMREFKREGGDVINRLRESLNKMTDNYRREVNNNIALAEKHHQLQADQDTPHTGEGAGVRRWTEAEVESRLAKERLLMAAEKEALASQLAEYSAVVQEEERVIEELRQVPHAHCGMWGMPILRPTTTTREPCTSNLHGFV